jgi:hypothetical protein
MSGSGSKDTSQVSDRKVSDRKAYNTVDSDYFALHRIPAIVQGREIGKIFAEAKGNLVVIAGENKKEHEYLIPKSKVSHYDDKKVYLNILDSSLKEFEV